MATVKSPRTYSVSIDAFGKALYMSAAGRFGDVLNEDYWLPREKLKLNERVYECIERVDLPRYGGRETTLAQHIGKLNRLAAKAPQNTKVVITFGVDRGYEAGDETAYYEVGYWRDPTDEEKAERRETNRKIAERDKRAAAKAEEKERAELERLQAKFAASVDTDPKG